MTDVPLSDSLARAWEWLYRVDGAKARFGVLATVSDHGAEARTVMLRGADRDTATIAVYTDALTPKLREIEAHPFGTLLFWDPDLSLQLRLKARFTTRPGTQDEWHQMPQASRLNYGTVPPPGREIATSHAFSRVADQNRFAVIEGRVDTIDMVELAQEPHRRAVFERGDGWAGRWLAP